jgi:hypothetical protein
VSGDGRLIYELQRTTCIQVEETGETGEKLWRVATPEEARVIANVVKEVGR